MKLAKNLIKKFLHPPNVVLYLTPFVFAGLILLFVTGKTERAYSYILYGLSAYALLICSIAMPRIWKAIQTGFYHNRLVQAIRTSPLGAHYFGNLSFRGSISLYQGMFMNALYVGFRLVTGICYDSVWFLSMAAYYLILGGLRAYLIVCHRKSTNPFRCYQRTAKFLFLLNIPMGGMILLMVQTNSGFHYPGSIIYLSALYTFYTFILSIFNLVKYRKYGDLILSASKVLTFISAVMSVLGLQTAMIARFSESGEDYRKLMNALTGGGVYLVVIVTAISMLIRCKKQENRWNLMKKSESKYFHTAARMDKAFLALLEKKDFAYITVKEICEQAGVNRSTFYLHYETIGDLLEESVSYMNQNFLIYMKHDAQVFAAKIKTCPLEELYLITPEYLTPYLSYIKEHRRMYRTAVEHATILQLEHTYSKMFRHIFTPILERYQVAASQHSYIMAFYIQGLTAIIDEWIKNDCTESIEQLIQIIQNCVPRREEKQ